MSTTLAESDAESERWWKDASSEERLYAVEAIRQATFALYDTDVPQRLVRVLVALDRPRGD